MRKLGLLIIFSFFVGTINVYASEENKLYDIVKNQAIDGMINFSDRSGKIGNETNGVYIITNTEGNIPVYYYRGIVNNNVIFNNMCWKIIRTTETKGIKLIYNGLSVSGKCNNMMEDTEIGEIEYNKIIDDNAYIGYMYGNIPSSSKEEAQKNINNSTIKTYIDEWYSNNFTSLNITNRIEDTVFYNDRSELQDSTNNTYYTDFSAGNNFYGKNTVGYGSILRASYHTIVPNPSLKYINANDKFTVSSENGNGKLTYPVGLITLDEAVLAGYNTFAADTSDYEDTNYLYNGKNYWTMSPVGYYSFLIAKLLIEGSCNGIITEKSIGFYFGNNKEGVRPVIALNNDVVVLNNQDGSSENPYTIELYTVKFADSDIDNQYIFDNNSRVIKPTEPSKIGYSFNGWYTEKSFNHLYDFDEVVNKDITLYPKWVKVENPYTHDGIIISFIIGGLALLILVIVCKRKNLKKY